MKKLLFSIFAAILMTSCGNIQTRRNLSELESYIMEYPDSALFSLDTMNRDILRTRRLKAHHALLHAMALDKNYIDVTDDSLAKVAVDYFSKHGPKKYEARALYYLGLSYYYAGDYNKAIIEFTKAEKVAERSDSLYWAMSNGLLGTVYSKTHNDKEASKYLRLALGIYLDINAQYYVDVTNFKLAKSYYNENMIPEADSILQSLVNRSDIVQDLKSAILTDYAFIKATQAIPDYKTSSEIYEKIMSDRSNYLMTRKDYWVYSYILSSLGRNNEADIIISQLKGADTSATAYYWQYRISKEQGNIHDALLCLEKSVSKNNLEITDALKQSLAVTQREYYESQFRETALKAQLRHQALIIIIVVSILVVLTICLLVQKYISEQKKEQERVLEYAEEINRQLSRYKDEDYPLLKKRFISLYKSRFETIGALCEQYLQNRNRDDAEKVMYQKVMLMVDDVRNDKVRKVKFEAVLDAELDNIMTRFREEMPKCKESDITLFSYLIAGFDATTISRLMNISLNNIYAQKRRLRIKIEEKTPKHMQQFLEMMH